MGLFLRSAGSRFSVGGVLTTIYSNPRSGASNAFGEAEAI
jgi:hypothetical protein